MKKLRKLLNDKVFQTILRCLLSFLFGLCFFLGYYFTHERTYTTLSTAFFIPSAILITIAIFSFINHLGGFDFVHYATISTASYLKKEPEKPFEDLIAYKEYKNEKREFEGPIYLPYLIFGLLYLLLALIFYFLFQSNI